MRNLGAFWCSWGHTSWFSTLSCDARHNCANSNCSCSPDGRWQCKHQPIKFTQRNHFWCVIIFFWGISDNLIEAALFSCQKLFFIKKIEELKVHCFAGWEGQSYPDTTICGWNQHITAIYVWNSFAGCNWRVIYLCSNNNLNYSCWSVQWWARSYRGHNSSCYKLCIVHMLALLIYIVRKWDVS